MKSFQQFDKDSKGFLVLEDLQRNIKKFGEKLTDDEIESIFYNCSSDGKIITLNDFFSVMTSGYET